MTVTASSAAVRLAMTGIASTCDRVAHLRMLVIGVPGPVVANGAVQGEDAAHQLAAVEFDRRAQAAFRHLR